MREDKAETREQIFSRYTHNFVFDTTRTVVKLFAHGVTLVSRSEAKRSLHGLEKFAYVILDSTNVESVGQGLRMKCFGFGRTITPTLPSQPRI